MSIDVTRWPVTDKIAEAIRRSAAHMPASLGHQLSAFLEPETLSIIAGTLAIWAGSHFFGVGEVVDVGLLLVGAFMVGWSITDVVRDLVDFGTTAYNARTDADLDRAARLFARAVVTAGVTTVLALLLRRSARGIQASRGASVADAARPNSPGLARVGADPQPGEFWSRPAIVGDASIAAGEGATTAFGDVTYSTAGSATETQLARLHELVHRFLSPRLRPFRTFRARLAMSAYSRSAIMTYIEEALAETFAQFRIFGLRGLLTGLRFPIANGYITLQTLVSEGAEIGTITLGDQVFSVQIVLTSPPPIQPPPPVCQ
jgi:hypothetical protein